MPCTRVRHLAHEMLLDASDAHRSNPVAVELGVGEHLTRGDEHVAGPVLGHRCGRQLVGEPILQLSRLRHVEGAEAGQRLERRLELAHEHLGLLVVRADLPGAVEHDAVRAPHLTNDRGGDDPRVVAAHQGADAPDHRAVDDRLVGDPRVPLVPGRARGRLAVGADGSLRRIRQCPDHGVEPGERGLRPGVHRPPGPRTRCPRPSHRGLPGRAPACARRRPPSGARRPRSRRAGSERAAPRTRHPCRR